MFGPMLNAYYSNSFTPFFVFFAMFLAVVRNENQPHFQRFNAMQSILLDICIMLGACGACVQERRATRRACEACRRMGALGSPFPAAAALAPYAEPLALFALRRAHHPVHAVRDGVLVDRCGAPSRAGAARPAASSSVLTGRVTRAQARHDKQGTCRRHPRHVLRRTRDAHTRVTSRVILSRRAMAALESTSGDRRN